MPNNNEINKVITMRPKCAVESARFQKFWNMNNWQKYAKNILHHICYGRKVVNDTYSDSEA